VSGSLTGRNRSAHPETSRHQNDRAQPRSHQKPATSTEAPALTIRVGGREVRLAHRRKSRSAGVPIFLAIRCLALQHRPPRRSPSQAGTHTTPPPSPAWKLQQTAARLCDYSSTSAESRCSSRARHTPSNNRPAPVQPGRRRPGAPRRRAMWPPRASRRRRRRRRSRRHRSRRHRIRRRRMR
jgi:hypothetical protein